MSYFSPRPIPMVFFNYSTMQMAAKVVYYGPGLCGKTTNLHYIYQHTVGESRGEMVSLETETDRTLFFDLLPIDVGSIAGFNTRIQLYTVPGQVFYNTTRKLVLKGVDGVVFVADSQRAMLQTNVESFRNLEENLTEMGLAVDTLPLVLQFNKRDLTDICSPDEMNAALNRHNWPFFEASAVTGMGVFETLKGISRFTLMSLKKRLGRNEPAPRPAAAAGAAKPAIPPPAAPPVAPSPNRPVAAPPPPTSGAYPQVPPAPAPTAASPQAQAPATQLSQAAQPAPRPAAPPVAAPPKAPPGVTGVKGRTMDVLGELEKLRREAAAGPATGSHRLPAPTGPRPGVPAPPPAAVAPVAPAPGSAGTNGRGELSRSIELTLRRADFQRARRVLVSFQVEDDQNRVMDAVRDLAVDIKDAANLEKLLLRLNIALNSKE
jgi:signal recognition particle receptor subunit beta